MKIWKYTLSGLNILEDSFIDMPVAAKILDVQEQNGTFQLWALIDPRANTVRRRFRAYMTGEEIYDHEMDYIKTVQLGQFVFHVFEVRD